MTMTDLSRFQWISLDFGHFGLVLSQSLHLALPIQGPCLDHGHVGPHSVLHPSTETTNAVAQ
jgi:hypothetical protein